MQRGLTFIASLFLCQIASGAVMILNNGDRLTGTLVSQDKETVRFKTELFGEVLAPTDQVDRIEEEVPGETAGKGEGATIVLKLGGAVGTSKQEVAEAAAASGVETSTIEKAVESQKLADDIKEALYSLPVMGSVFSYVAEYYPLKDWKSNLSMGLSVLTGQTNTRDLTMFFSTEKKADRREWRFEAKRDYQTTETTTGEHNVTRDQTRLSGRLRYDLQDALFVQSNTQYSNARIQGIENNLSQSLGVGWRFIKTKRWNGSLTPSVTTQYQEVKGEDSQFDWGPTLYQEIVYKFNERITFRQESNVTVPVATGEASYNFLLRMETRMIDSVSFNIEYDYDYDGAVAETKDPEQQKIKTTIGVTF